MIFASKVPCRTGFATPSATVVLPCRTGFSLPDGVFPCRTGFFPAGRGFSLPDGVCNPVRNGFPAGRGSLPDGVCNPVRNGCAVRRTFRTGLQHFGRGCKPRPALWRNISDGVVAHSPETATEIKKESYGSMMRYTLWCRSHDLILLFNHVI